MAFEIDLSVKPPSDIEITPAVLPKSLDDLTARLESVRGAAPWVQVDVVDGVLATPKTWPYRDRGSFEKIVKEEHGLPFWGEMSFEFDLMITRPDTEVLKFTRAGGTRMVLHAESEGVEKALQVLVDLRGDSGEFQVSIGMALLPHMQPDVLEAFEAQCDFVQVMGIDRIGRQGEPFDKQAIYLIERLRRRYPGLTIQVDGGVNADTIQSLVRAGANRLVAGSAIFGSEDPKRAIQELQALAQEAKRAS